MCACETGCVGIIIILHGVILLLVHVEWFDVAWGALVLG